MSSNNDKLKALKLTMDKIDKDYGKGSVMMMNEKAEVLQEVISTGSIALDSALGIGGLPKGRIVEIYGPESSGKTTIAIHVIAEAQKKGGMCAIIDAEHAFDSSYAQAVAVTGRLSSTNPNLQNIPVRTDRGKEIRKAFIPRDPSRILVSADYSQIELRVVAAISGDPNMCEAFKLGKDIHTATAAKVYGVDEADVTKEMRYKAKSVNFGIIYGQGAFGLAENLGISRTEAKEIIDNYKKEFPNIQKYMDQQINHAKELGFVETLMGRKRWLRDINSSNFTVRGFAERNAINSPIQGSAADMIKLAMIKIHNAMKAKTWESKMILQVHDELIFDATEKELPALKELILSCMTTAMELPNGVPVEAELGTGKNWLEAH